jgi:hypothetical protein
MLVKSIQFLERVPLIQVDFQVVSLFLVFVPPHLQEYDPTRADVVYDKEMRAMCCPDKNTQENTTWIQIYYTEVMAQYGDKK